MLYKIYYELKDGMTDYFLMWSNNTEKDKKMIKHQVKLREGKFLRQEKVYIKSK